MPVTKKVAKEVVSRAKQSIFQTEENSPETNLDKEILGLARSVIKWMLILFGILFFGLFILLFTNNTQAGIFKDSLSAFVAVGSGVLGSVLGYYYKSTK